MARLNILKLRAVAPVAPAPPAPEPAVVRAPEMLCRRCALAHVVHGHSAPEEVILCGLGGWLRDLPFPVARCTDYRERSERAAGRAGFGAGV